MNKRTFLDSVGPLKLDDTWTNDFESGNEDKYRIQIKDIGSLTAMELRTDNRHESLD